jgi:hypothetical protein
MAGLTSSSTITGIATGGSDPSLALCWFGSSSANPRPRARTPQNRPRADSSTQRCRLMIDNASARLETAKLRLGWLLNLTGEIRSERLKVTHQDPTGGTIVPEGTAVNLRVDLAQPPQGVKTLGLYGSVAKTSF